MSGVRLDRKIFPRPSSQPANAPLYDAGPRFTKIRKSYEFVRPIQFNTEQKNVCANFCETDRWYGGSQSETSWLCPLKS